MVREILDAQQLIADYWKVLNGFADDMFAPLGREAFRSLLVGHGIIGQFVRHRDSRLQFDAARLGAIRTFAAFSNARRIFQEVARNHVPEVRVELSGAAGAAQSESDMDYLTDQGRRRHVPARILKENVDRQKAEIRRHMLHGDISWVRRLVRELVDSQLKTSESKYAAMSVTDLANDARDIENYSLQCELAHQAVQLVPEDAKAVGQLGDALLRLGRIDDARTEFARAAALGSVEFGRIGAARVLRTQNKLPEAVEEFERAVADFPGDYHALVGLAETYRELWRFEDAVHTYDRAIALDPERAFLWCGRAAVLADMGKLNESLQAYAEADSRFVDNVVAKCGRAHVLFLAGEMESSLTLYDKLVEEASGYSVAWCGRSAVLAELGLYEEALRGYAVAIERFPWSIVGWCGRAETLKEMRQFDRAVAAYDEAGKRFSNESRVHTGRANVLRRSGKLSAALQSYDGIISRFPFDLVAQCSRAHLLKEFGRLEEAEKAYDRILEHNSRNDFVRFSRAAILAVNGEIDRALEELPAAAPRTRDQWVGWHIRGMVLLRAGRLAEGVEVLSMGESRCPFARERSYFRRALAVTELRDRRFAAASNLIDNDDRPLQEVLRIHAYGALGQFEKASVAYNRIGNVELPPYLVQLRSQLGRRYRLEYGRMTANWEWIFREECRAILLAV